MPNPDTVYLATSQDTLFSETRDNLKSLGYSRCVRFSSGRALVEFATYNGARIIVVDSALEDMLLAEVVAALRTIHQSEPMHILAISQDRTEEFVLGIIASGCSGLILRPYTLSALGKYMRVESVAQPHDADMETVQQAEAMIDQGRFEEAIGDLSLFVSQEETQASEFFFQGCQHLVEKKWSEAIRAFSQSLSRNHTFIKAYEGLAKAYLGKNDLEHYKFYLHKAAEEYARMDNFAKVKRIFVEIIKYDVNAPNPYNTLGIRLRQEKQYKEAIQAYLQAIALSPEDENIYFNMAKAYFCDNNPDKAQEYCRQALILSPEHVEAMKLLRTIANTAAAGVR